MKAELKLVETINLQLLQEQQEVYVLNLRTKVRGEKDCHSCITYGVTVNFFSDGTPFIFHNGIYNMVTGKTRFVKSVEKMVLEMIEKGDFVKAEYYKEYTK